MITALLTATGTEAAKGGFFAQYGGTLIMVVLLIGVFYLMHRSSKKQEKEVNDMRNSLEIGDEITTIGGIIGEIVRIKDETVTIETGKDRTKIRILRSAVKNVDVHAYEKNGTGKKPVDDKKATKAVNDPAKTENIDQTATTEGGADEATTNE